MIPFYLGLIIFCSLIVGCSGIVSLCCYCKHRKRRTNVLAYYNPDEEQN